VPHFTLPAIKSFPHTRLGISFQIAQKMVKTFRDIQNGKMFDKASNKNKRKQDLYVAGHKESLNPCQPPHPTSLRCCSASF
jgi:hypothetical protein